MPYPNLMRYSAFTLDTQRLCRHLLPLFIISVLAGCNPSETPSEDILAIHTTQASAYLKSGQYRAASIEARNLIQKAPQQSTGYLLLASITNELGRHKETLQILDRIPANGKNQWAYIDARTQAFLGRGKFVSASDLLQKHSAFKSQKPHEYLVLQAKTQLALAEFDKSEALYNELLALSNNSEITNPLELKSDALIGLAKISASKGLINEAENYLAELNIIHPKSIEAGVLRANIALENQNFELAESHLSNTLINLRDTDTLTPTKANILKSLSEILIKQGRSAEALVYTQILAESFPGYDIAQEEFQRATALYQNDNKAQAEKILEQLVQDYPGFEKAAVLLGILKFEGQNYSAAADLFNANVDAELTNSKVTELTALSNLQTRQPRKVIALLAPIIEKSSNSILLSIYGSAALATGDPSTAKETLERALSADPENTLAIASLAEFYEQLNPPNLKQSIALIEQASTLNPENIDFSSRLARLHLALGDKEKALAIVQQQLEAHDKNSASLILAGDLFAALDNSPKAIHYYEQALAKDATSFSAAIKLAELRAMSEKRFDVVSQAYLNAIAIQPTRLLGYQRLIAASVKHKQFEVAEHKLNQLSQQTGVQEPYAILALFNAEQGNIESSLNYLNKFKTSPTTEKLHKTTVREVNFLNARTHLRLGAIAEAKEAIFTALKQDSQSIQLLSLLVEIEIASGDYSEAHRLAQQLLGENEALARQLLGNIATKKNDWADALMQYQTSWDLTPNDSTGEKLYSTLAQQTTEKANSFLQTWLAKIPNSISANMILARDFLVAKDYTPAIQVMEKIRTLQPNNPVNLNNLAWALSQTGNNKALSVAEKAAQLSPKDPNILDTYGWILFHSNQPQLAEQTLIKALELSPENKAIKQHLDTIRSAKPS